MANARSTTFVPGGADNSKSCLEISGKIRAQQPAFAGAMFSPGVTEMQPEDLSGYRKISFWVKGLGDDIQVMMFTKKRGFQPSIQFVSAGKDWNRMEFELSDFDGSDGKDVVGFWFGKGTAGEYKFWIDQVQLELWLRRIESWHSLRPFLDGFSEVE